MLVYIFLGIKIFLLLDQVEAKGIVPGAQKSFTLSFFWKEKQQKKSLDKRIFVYYLQYHMMNIWAYIHNRYVYVCIYVYSYIFFFLHHFFSWIGLDLTNNQAVAKWCGSYGMLSGGMKLDTRGCEGISQKLRNPPRIYRTGCFFCCDKKTHFCTRGI